MVASNTRGPQRLIKEHIMESPESRARSGIDSKCHWKPFKNQICILKSILWNTRRRGWMKARQEVTMKIVQTADRWGPGLVATETDKEEDWS